MTFKGLIPPLVTPLSGDDSLDREGLSRLIEHVIEGGVTGIFILGTTGEGPSLSYRLRREVIQHACNQVASRVPVLTCVSDTSSAESLKLAGWAADCGSDAVVTTVPYYFPAGQPEILEYLQGFIPRMPLPVTLYNMPTMTKLTLEVETLRRLTAIENIKGVKDSSGDMEYFRNLLSLKAERPDWSLLNGTESLLVESVRLGGDGGVNGGANIFPSLFSGAYEAASSGDTARAEKLNRNINLLQEIYAVGPYVSRYIKATKCALSLLGICEDHMAPPFLPFGARERQQVDRVIGRLATTS